MDQRNEAELVILPDPTVKLLPFVLVLMATIGLCLAFFVPDGHFLVRIAVAAVMVGLPVHEYLTVVRRLVVGEDAVDIQLMRKTVRIPYARLALVTVRAWPTSLVVVFETRNPQEVIRTSTPLIRGEVPRIAPRLIRALIVHGVAVEVPGRPDLSAP
jgi:hypothetical protein